MAFGEDSKSPEAVAMGSLNHVAFFEYDADTRDNHCGKECRNPKTMDGTTALPLPDRQVYPCDLDTSIPCRYDGLA